VRSSDRFGQQIRLNDLGRDEPPFAVKVCMNLITDRGNLLRGQVEVLVEVVRASLDDQRLLEAGEGATDRVLRNRCQTACDAWP
jgi:hypothetical protein